VKGEGFTMIPNDLMDALCRAVEMKNAERCVLLYLVRQSLGYSRKDTSTFGSVRAIAEATGLQARTVHSALKSLRGSGFVVKLSDAVGTTPAVYRVTTPDPQITPDLQITPDQEIICRPDPQITPSPDPQITPYKTKNKKRTNNYLEAPQADKKWTADRLFFQLGGRGTIPPFVQGKWLAISERSDEDIETALRKVRNFQVPRNRFLDLFDDEGQDLSPEWEQRARERRQGPRESTEEDRAASNARIIADFEKWKQTRN
jgi:hypothetical protein